MEKVSESALLIYGSVLKSNNFTTSRGFYTIRIISYEGQLYFHKTKDGNLVELINLTEMEKRV